MKTAQINIGGETRDVNYSVSGWYDHLGEVAGKDALTFLGDLNPKEGESLKIGGKEMSYIVYAGINAAHDVKKEPHDNIAEVQRLLRATTFEDLGTAYSVILDCISVAPGEGQSQPGGS